MATRAITDVPSDLADRLDLVAAQLERPSTEIVAEVLNDWLDTEDWKHQDTLAAMAEVRAGRTIDNERVMAWIDSLSTDNPLPMPQPEP